VPAVFAELAFGLAPIAETPRDRIRLITNTGSKIPGPVFERLLELFPQADLSLNYGLTETYRSAMLPVALAREKRSAVGHPAPGVTLLVLREDGTRAAPEEEGEIVHAGPGVFEGYWNDPERTARVRFEMVLETGERLPAVRTGDFGRFGTDGLLYVHGRRDRQIKCMGVRVSPDEIEQHLYDTGLLREVAITAPEHEMFGALITAHVVPSDPDLPEKKFVQALRKAARQTMSVYMQPRVYVLHSVLPRNANAKIDYPDLTGMSVEQPEGANG
jgi:acyl-coenzyme A synthetase/AMP-(fatty) acid ligase